MTVSLYNSTVDKSFTIVSPESVIQGIANGRWAEYINYLQTLNKEEYKAEKKNLPAVTWSCTCLPGTRSAETVSTYSNLVVIDIDNLEPSIIESLKADFRNDPYVKYCFVSPSGKGIKVVVSVNTGPKEHRAAFLHLQDYFEKTYLVKVDSSGKDICRLCYVSYDPKLIIKDNQIFQVDLKYGEIITQHTPQLDNMKASHDTAKIWAVCTKWLENGKSKFQYVEGQRNVYIHAMACALNRCGVDIDTAINLISINLPTPDQKWHQSVRSAYIHNQHEHGSIQVRDVGATEFVTPVYIMEEVSDVAARDLMTTTAMLHSFKVPYNYILDIVSKIGNYYQKQGYINLENNYLHILMNEALKVMQSNIQQQVNQNALENQSAGDYARDVFSMGGGEHKTYLNPFDTALGGGLSSGNVYGLIGYGGTFKSFLIQYMSYMDAMNDIPSLYINGEMSRFQYLERAATMVYGIDLKKEIQEGRINPGNIESFVAGMNTLTKNNMQVYSGKGFKKENIVATCDKYFAKTGKRIKRIYIDGLAQFDWAGREEINANIANSFIVKELAKEVNDGGGAVVMVLIHCSGTPDYTIRDTSTRIRGGAKVQANLDAYFCTSLLVDQSIQVTNAADVKFIPGKFHLFMHDKRSKAGDISAIVNMTPILHMEVENTDPVFYEIQQQQNQYR